VRHTLTSLLLAAVAAVLAGARSFTAVGEWVADAPPQVLASLGVRYDPLAGRFRPPDEATIRRVLEAVDADALDAAVGPWLGARLRAADQRPGRGRRRRALAVDGKAVRGTRHAAGDGQAVHLLAVADQQAGAVLAQASVDGNTNEITQFAPLLQPLDLAGSVITADALHAQREHATYLARRGAHYLLIVKRNQPSLHTQLAALPWRDVPKAYDKAERGHGRTERRTLKVTSVAAGLAFPHAAQAIQITRRRTVKGKWSRETCYAVTSLTLTQASYTQLAASSAATGASKTGCTGSATSTSTKTAPRSAPPAAPASWPACATWSSPSCAWPEPPASPPLCATTPGGPAAPSRRS
jgi:predicted transposase YbfD/YdcC